VAHREREAQQRGQGAADQRVPGDLSLLQSATMKQQRIPRHVSSSMVLLFAIRMTMHSSSTSSGLSFSPQSINQLDQLIWRQSVRMRLICVSADLLQSWAYISVHGSVHLLMLNTAVLDGSALGALNYFGGLRSARTHRTAIDAQQ